MNLRLPKVLYIFIVTIITVESLRRVPLNKQPIYPKGNVF